MGEQDQDSQQIARNPTSGAAAVTANRKSAMTPFSHLAKQFAETSAEEMADAQVHRYGQGDAPYSAELAVSLWCESNPVADSPWLREIFIDTYNYQIGLLEDRGEFRRATAGRRYAA